jgi:hypothetical protein
MRAERGTDGTEGGCTTEIFVSEDQPGVRGEAATLSCQQSTKLWVDPGSGLTLGRL